eukprot:6142967-Prymnesium_polylepis.1
MRKRTALGPWCHAQPCAARTASGRQPKRRCSVSAVPWAPSIIAPSSDAASQPIAPAVACGATTTLSVSCTPFQRARLSIPRPPRRPSSGWAAGASGSDTSGRSCRRAMVAAAATPVEAAS